MAECRAVRSSQFRRLRRTLLVSTAVVALGLPAVARAEGGTRAEGIVLMAQAAAERMQFSIPAQGLDSALTAFADQAGLRLMVRSADVAGREAPAVSGRYTAEGALGRLLAGSGLTYRLADGVVTVAQASTAEDGRIELAPITVGAAVSASDIAAPPQEEGYWSERSSASGFRAKPVLDTPSSVTSFPAEVIRDQQARTVTDVARNDPSVTQAESPLWYDRLMVRGFYLSTDAIYRDGLTINDQGRIALENKAAVEVNKGLSVLRYGVTSPGGVVNYRLKRPTDDPLARVQVFGAHYGSRGVHGDVGGRFGKEDQFGVRLNAALSEDRNHLDDYESETKFVSGFFDWRATDDLLVEFDFEHQDRDAVVPYSLGLWQFDSIDDARAAFPNLTPENSYTVAPWSNEHNVQTYYSGRLTYQFADDWKLRLAAQRSELERDGLALGARSIQPNLDFTPRFWFNAAPDERNNDAYQVVIEGDVSTFGVEHALAFGYDDLRRDMLWSDDASGTLPVANLNGSVPPPDPALLMAGPSVLRNRTDQQSFFLTDTLSFTDQFELFAGLRHTHIERYSGGGVGVAPRKTYDQSAVNPVLGLVYKPRDNVTLYTSYSEGIEIGGIAPRGTVNENEAMPPLASSQIEAGVKYEFNDRALLTAALFQIDKGLEYINSANRYVQDGRQVHRGVEATLSGQVTDDLRLIAGVAFLDAEVEKTADASLIGKRPQGVPEWRANLYADYHLSSLVPGLFVNGGVMYVGDKPIDRQNTWMADGYALLNAGVRYEHMLGDETDATFRLNVENLTDEEYLANTSFGYLNFGDPLTVKASVQVEF